MSNNQTEDQKTEEQNLVDEEEQENPIEAYEKELEDLRGYAGLDPVFHPLRWIRWETSYKYSSGYRAPNWRKEAGEIGYILAMTHDKGRTIIAIKIDGTCNVIKGYKVEENGFEQLDYEPISAGHKNLIEALTTVSEVFAHFFASQLEEQSQEDVTITLQKPIDNSLITLPKPVMIIFENEVIDELDKLEPLNAEDDEVIVPYPKQPPSDAEYWQLCSKLKMFVQNPLDPQGTELKEVVDLPLINEPNGHRAVLQTQAIPSMINLISVRRDQIDSKKLAQIEIIFRILAIISVNPLVRKSLANEETVHSLFEIIQVEEVKAPLSSTSENIFKILSNCCKNRGFRSLVLKREYLQPLITRLPNQAVAPKAAYVLWMLNRNPDSTNLFLDEHINIELEKIVNSVRQSEDEDLVLNIVRLLYSIGLFGDENIKVLTNHQIAYFCRGLDSQTEELVAWSAKSFTVYKIPESYYKLFVGANCQGPKRLVSTLNSKNSDVILAGLETIATVGIIPRIKEELFQGEANVIPGLKNLWRNENPEIIKGVLKVLSVLADHPRCARWTVTDNLIPGLLNFLKQSDPDFVVYAARAIGSCCQESENLTRLMNLKGVRTLWSFMKSPIPMIQAAATEALVPFLQYKESPYIIRTFVDGLYLLTDLLRSDDTSVQAAACMAISEIAKDKENLSVLTDLGLIELLCRLLTTQDDAVRRSLADAIGFSADWANNRRRFGEEGVVGPLVTFLRPPSTNKDVHASTAKALRVLSEDQQNAKTLSQAGVVDYLLAMVESNDPDLQMAGAIAIRNIRTNR